MNACYPSWNRSDWPRFVTWCKFLKLASNCPLISVQSLSRGSAQAKFMWRTTVNEFIEPIAPADLLPDLGPAPSLPWLRPLSERSFYLHPPHLCRYLKSTCRILWSLNCMQRMQQFCLTVDIFDKSKKISGFSAVMKINEETPELTYWALFNRYGWNEKTQWRWSAR